MSDQTPAPNVGAVRKSDPDFESPNPDTEIQNPGGFYRPHTNDREDWTEFRDISRLSGRAGASRDRIPACVVKELVDNAMDAAGNVSFGILNPSRSAVTFFVSNTGDGMEGDDELLAWKFSFGRGMSSSNAIRLPSRGMLGNGLRVVAGAVYVSEGHIRLSTRGRTLTLVPREDGTTAVEKSEPWAGSGTRIEITLGAPLARKCDVARLFEWATPTQKMLGSGDQYKGRSSAWWYNGHDFWEVLISSAPGKAIEQVVGAFEGFSARKTLKELLGADWGREACKWSKSEACELLKRMKSKSAKVDPKRLGCVGRKDDYLGYAVVRGEHESDGDVVIPYVIEVWANRSKSPNVQLAVNRTPVMTNVWVARHGDPTKYQIGGADLSDLFQVGAKHVGEYTFFINVIAPYVPRYNSGKDPSLDFLATDLTDACEKAVRVLRRENPRQSTVSKKSIILSHIKEASRTLSSGGRLWFSLRQLFYGIRPHLIEATGKEPEYGYFCRVIGAYEDRHGDIEKLYRDDRGVLIHPHTRERIALGTRAISNYERPEWAFNKILFLEKEGFFPLLLAERWPERHDCALVTSKGFASRAARDLIRRLSKTKHENIEIFCVHDADGPGTVIFESLQKALEPKGINVVNLGLDPEEARAMGLQHEEVKKKKKRIPVGSYIPEEDQEWLQENRIELNAMTSEQFVDWLDQKMAANTNRGKVIPPAAVVERELSKSTAAALRDRIVADTLHRAGLDELVSTAMGRLASQFEDTAARIRDGLPTLFAESKDSPWTRAVVEQAAKYAAEYDDRTA